MSLKSKLIGTAKRLVSNSVKGVMFRAYGLLFSCVALLPVKENRVVLFSAHNANFTDGLGEIEKELQKRGGYDIIRVDRQDMLAGGTRLLKFMTLDNMKMARAKYIFLNNNFFPMNYMHFNKDTTVVQVWHGQGVFKKWGMDIPQPKRERKLELGVYAKTDYVVCSAPSCQAAYASAFNMKPEQVLTTGNPVQDQYFGEEHIGEAACATRRAAFDKQYPECAGKYLVLYSPTFRDDGTSVLDHMDLGRLKAAVDTGLKATKSSVTECQILLRLHPHDAEAGKPVNVDGVTDMNQYPNSNDLCYLADVMITDYSSICMNMALLDKPMVFYAYDLQDFARDFCYPYETVGGPICTTMEDLIATFEAMDFADSKRAHFRELHFGTPTAGATARLLDAVMK